MTRPSSTDFSDLAASSAVFSSATAAPTLALQLDGIPRLTRTLQQVSDTSLDALRSRPGASDETDDVHADALRLLAQRGFASESLRRAMSEIAERSPFVTRSARHRHVDGDAAQLLHLQRAAVASRAADEARLEANALFRTRFTATMVDDLASACAQLVSRLDEVAQTRGVSTRTAIPVHPSTSYAASLPARSPDAMQRTPRTPYATPRVASSFTDYSTIAGTAHTPRTPSSTHPQLLCVADSEYLTVIRSLLLEGDAPSVASLMHETASYKPEHPHLREILAVLANLATFVGPELPADYLRVHAARTVLEDQFAERSEVLLVKPRQASAVAIRKDVRTYVQYLIDKNELADVGDSPHTLDGVSLWAQVFYSFRVGNLEAARNVLLAAKENGNNSVNNYFALLECFLSAKRNLNFSDESKADFVVGSLNNIHEFNTLLEEYRTKVWRSGDTYYRACYMLLARLELAPATPKVKDDPESVAYPLQPPHQRTSLPFPDSDFNALFGSVEDYMWMRLFQCRTELEKPIVSNLPEYHFVEFSQVQKEILACGPGHFDSHGTQPFLYAFVLTCAGLYWEAVEFLSNASDELYVAGAAHIAIVLHLLQWSEGKHDFGAILWAYVSNFAKSQPAEAAAYMLTIRDRDSLLEWLRTLIFETGEFAALLGTSTDSSDKGALQGIVARMPTNFPVISDEDLADLRRSSARWAGAQARDREHYHQAAELFALAGDRQTSLKMLLLGLAVVVDSRGGPNRSLAISQGRRAYKVMQDGGETGAIPRSLHMLLAIAAFFDEYHSGRLSSAWAILTSMQILPLNEDTILARRGDLLPSSDRFDQAVRGCAAALLRAALDICEHALISGKAVSEPSSSASFHRPFAQGTPRLPCRSQIKALVTFSGLMGLAETEVNARLVRIELLLA